jgi:AraC-like DNA-binding protein
MIYFLLNFLVAFLALVAFGVILHSSKKNEETINYYFLIILLGLTAQRLFYTSLILSNVNIENKLNYSFVAYFYVPLFYLFLKNFLKYKISQKENLTHFALASVIVLINLFFEIDGSVKAVLFLIFSTIYLFLILKKTVFYFKEEKKLLKSKKHWFFIMLFVTIVIYLAANFFLFRYTENTSIVLKEFYNFTSIIWIVCLTYLFINPEIFFGAKKLKFIIRKEEITIKNIWKPKPFKKIEEYDKKIHNKIAPNSINIINKIERYIEGYDFHNNLPLDFKSISKGINIKAYHLNYIFKYYCIYSKNDLFNYYKIMHVLALIEEGYLQHKTINSLISHANFKSQKTFHNNFKKFAGKSPQEMNNVLKFKL